MISVHSVYDQCSFTAVMQYMMYILTSSFDLSSCFLLVTDDDCTPLAPPPTSIKSEFNATQYNIFMQYSTCTCTVLMLKYFGVVVAVSWLVSLKCAVYNWDLVPPWTSTSSNQEGKEYL